MPPLEAERFYRETVEGDFEMRDSRHGNERKAQRSFTTMELVRALPGAQIHDHFWDEPFANWKFVVHAWSSTGRPIRLVLGLAPNRSTVWLVTVHQVPRRWMHPG